MSSNSSFQNSTNLDLLRAVAVTFVVLDHAMKFLGHQIVLGREIGWVGVLGVMLFFVHTCTVLMVSLERLALKSSGFRLWMAFYIRRVFRIYPLSIFAIAVVLSFGIPSHKIEGFHVIGGIVPTKAEVIASVMLLQNLFPHGGREIIGVLWSLPYEIQMYLVLPGLFLIFARQQRLRGLLMLWVASWGIAYVLPPLRFVPEFLPGVIAYVIALKYKGKKLSALLFPIFLALLAISYLAVGPSFLVARFVCLALGLLLPFFVNIQFAALNVLTHHIAKYSYGVYLCHLFCLWFAFNRVPIFHGLSFFVLLIVVPIALFHLIESPLIGVGAKIAGALPRLHVPTKQTLVISASQSNVSDDDVALVANRSQAL